MGLNDLRLGQGDILSVEALQEALSTYNGARPRMEAEHVYDAEGRLVHPQPRWATAIAYMAVDQDATLISRGGLSLRWARGFKSDPRMDGPAAIRWELEATGPQLVQVGLEWGDADFPHHFYEEIRFLAGGGNGRGALTFTTSGGGEFSPRDVTEGIVGILLVVRAF